MMTDKIQIKVDKIEDRLLVYLRKYIEVIVNFTIVIPIYLISILSGLACIVISFIGPIVIIVLPFIIDISLIEFFAMIVITVFANFVSIGLLQYKKQDK